MHFGGHVSEWVNCYKISMSDFNSVTVFKLNIFMKNQKSWIKLAYNHNLNIIHSKVIHILKDTCTLIMCKVIRCLSLRKVCSITILTPKIWLYCLFYRRYVDIVHITYSLSWSHEHVWKQGQISYIVSIMFTQRLCMLTDFS